MLKNVRIELLVPLIIALLVSGCIDEKNARVTNPSSTHTPGIDEKNAKVTIPGTPPTPSRTTEPAVEELSPFEEEMIGKWSRYHSYDGSTMYSIFKSDRTGCYFETIDGSRKKEQAVKWKLEPLGKNRFEVTLTTATGSYLRKDIYDYVNDVVFRGGYDNLEMTRSSTSIDCS